MTERQSAQSVTSIILNHIPADAEITRVEYEGPRIAIYSKNPKFLQQNSYIVSDVVNLVKRRVVVRTDKSIRKEEQEAQDIIMASVPAEAGVEKIFFDGAIGEAILEARKPLQLSVEKGFNPIEITDKTGWKIRVRKLPHIPCQSIQNVNYVLSQSVNERAKFFRDVGENIFRPRLSQESEVGIMTLGAFEEVGRSSIIVNTSESKLLLDCGIHPGSRNAWDAFPRLDWADIELDELDAVIISHAHLDHTGFLPALFKYGYEGPVYCTEPTLPLMTLLQGDMVKIGQLEGGRLVYDHRDIRELIKHTITVPYGLVTDVAPDVKLVFNNAGHILGSATVHLHIGEGAHNIVYTGDYKYGKTLLLESAFWNYPRVETLITESTYGTKEDIMPSREEVETLFTNLANDTLKQGGKVLIPVPAVGRAQEIILLIDHYMREKKLTEAPVFIEGMISEATAIHIAYPEYLSRELKYKILEEDANPFSSEYFTVIEHPSNREEALREGGAIIMATSGMLEGGPVIEYFSQLASSEKNRVMFVSYQVQGTMGRRVLDGSHQVSLLGEGGKIRVIDVNCQVNRIEGLSGHSDYNQIVRYIQKVRPKLQQIFVNHGEKRKCESLAYNLSRMFKLPVYHPQVEEAIKIH
ncbi:MAG TPA: beta-CASP ribonuclease aCPSF1 [Nitrososphaerales archaeon]|nr:beta-CASP ribonuclease aCPSF1 [Nitrososphaerales archaeon]